eukprot:6624193-Prymnesium_polylepis.1
MAMIETRSWTTSIDSPKNKKKRKMPAGDARVIRESHACTKTTESHLWLRGIVAAFEHEHAHVHEHERQIVERHHRQVQRPAWQLRTPHSSSLI